MINSPHQAEYFLCTTYFKCLTRISSTEKNCNTEVVSIHTPTSNNETFFMFLPRLCSHMVLIFASLLDKNMDLSVVLIYISFIMSEIECPSIYLQAICISFSGYYSFISLPAFLLWVLVFCLLIPRSSSYIRKIGLYLWIELQIFFPVGLFLW